jgi:hypothetical protein
MSLAKSRRCSAASVAEEPQRYEQAVVDVELVTAMLDGNLSVDYIKRYNWYKWKLVHESNKKRIERDLEEGIYVNMTGCGFSSHKFHYKGEAWSLGLQHLCFVHKKADVEYGILIRPIPKGCKVYQLLMSMKSFGVLQADFVSMAGDTISLEFPTDHPLTVAAVKHDLQVHLFKMNDISMFVPVNLVRDSDSKPLGSCVKLWDPSWDAPRCGGVAVRTRITTKQPGQKTIKSYLKDQKK